MNAELSTGQTYNSDKHNIQGGDVVKITPCKRWFLWSLILVLLLIGIPVWAGEEGVVKSGVANIRNGPGISNAVITQVKSGQVLPVLDRSSSWLKVQLQNGQTGWIHNSLVNIRTVTEKKVVVTGSSVNVRKGPGTGFPVVGKVHQGETLPVLGAREGWYNVKVAGVGQAWIAGWLVKDENSAKDSSQPSRSSSSAKQLVVTGNGVHVRKGPGTNYTSVAKVYKNSKYTIIDQKNGWYKIQVGSKQGWVAGWLVSVPSVQSPVPPAPPVPPATPVPGGSLVIMVTGGVVNVRQGTGTETAIVSKVYRGERLVVTEKQGDWYKVQLANGQSGWVASWLTEPVQGSDASRGGWQRSEVLIVPIAENQVFKVAELAGRVELVLEGWASGQFQVKQGSAQDKLILEMEANSTRNYEGEIKRLGISRVRVYPQNNKSIVELDFASSVTYSVAYDSNSKTATIRVGTAQTKGLQGKIIVIDPGHASVQPGGWLDPGAVGPRTNLYEKDVVLDIAVKVKQMLEQAGARVIMTHMGRTELTLAGRAEIANVNNADIFVSIHANSSDKGLYSGHSTYFYAPYGDEILGSQRYERQKLATLVQREMVKMGGRMDIGVLEANFAVLRETRVPSILVETAFISDPQEEILLGQDVFRTRLAIGIFNGIKAYFE